MAKSQPLNDILCYCYSENKPNRSKIRKFYKLFRKENDIPDRCDIPECKFHSGELGWNGKPLPLILDHIDGCSNNNHNSNLRFLCPNCNAQQERTRGGANKGRIQNPGPSGYAVVEKNLPDREIKVFDKFNLT